MASEVTRDEAMREMARRELERRRGGGQQQEAQPIGSANPGWLAPFSLVQMAPISRDAKGNMQFDSNAGILGMAKRAFMLPGQAMKGEVQLRDPQTGNFTDEAIRRSIEAAAIYSPISPASRLATRAVGAKQVAPPSREMLQEAGATGFETSRKMGVDYSAQSVKGMADAMRTKLEQDGVFAELAPNTFKILDKLANPPKDSIATIEGLHAARRALKNARLNFTNPTEKFAADRLITAIDDFITKPDPAAVVAGPAAAAGKTFKDALGNYAAAKRSEQLADGLVITPSHNPPDNGGIKYNPPNGGPADTDVTDWVAQRANELLKNGNRDVKRRIGKAMSGINAQHARRRAGGAWRCRPVDLAYPDLGCITRQPRHAVTLEAVRLGSDEGAGDGRCNRLATTGAHERLGEMRADESVRPGDEDAAARSAHLCLPQLSIRRALPAVPLRSCGTTARSAARPRRAACAAGSRSRARAHPRRRRSR